MRDGGGGLYQNVNEFNVFGIEDFMWQVFESEIAFLLLHPTKPFKANTIVFKLIARVGQRK